MTNKLKSTQFFLVGCLNPFLLDLLLMLSYNVGLERRFTGLIIKFYRNWCSYMGVVRWSTLKCLFHILSITQQFSEFCGFLVK